MINIKNREELARLLNNFTVDTYPEISKPGRQINISIIYNKNKDKFYKVEWGEITNENQVNFLWYNDIAEEVILNPKGNKGWFTKNEIKNLKYKGELQVQNNIITIKLTDEVDNLENIKTMGTGAGKGNTWHAIMKATEALIENKNVLYLSTELTQDEIMNKIKQVIIESSVSNSKWLEFSGKTKEEKIQLAIELINTSNIKIVCNPNLNMYYILSEMKYNASYQSGLVVIIDHLQMALDKKLRNTKEIQAILDYLEKTAKKLNCEIIVITQIMNEEL